MRGGSPSLASVQKAEHSRATVTRFRTKSAVRNITIPIDAKTSGATPKAWSNNIIWPGDLRHIVGATVLKLRVNPPTPGAESRISLTSARVQPCGRRACSGNYNRARTFRRNSATSCSSSSSPSKVLASLAVRLCGLPCRDTSRHRRRPLRARCMPPKIRCRFNGGALERLNQAMLRKTTSTTAPGAT